MPVLRPYQEKAIEAIESKGEGRWLIQMATGLGKTFVFTSLKRQGRTLVLAHREELLRQASSYYDCPVGIEQAESRSAGEEVVCASVQSMHKRLNSFSPHAFDRVIVDECHHSSASTYRRILDWFKPRQLLGFTATPNRSDDVGLHTLYDDVIFEYDIRRGIEDGWLARLKCKQIQIGYDISQVARKGDFVQGELARAMNIASANKAIVEAIRAEGLFPTLVFAVDVEHAHAIAREYGQGAVALDGTSKDRATQISLYKEGKIEVLVNCELFTEGTDLPETRCVVLARPTASQTLYIQMAGRGLRKTQTKEECLLIDCVGVTGEHSICQAPTLIGLDSSMVRKGAKVEGDLLLDIPQVVVKESDTPHTWIKNCKLVDIWSKVANVNTRKVNYFRMPDSSLIVMLPENWIKVTPEDMLGRVDIISTYIGLSAKHIYIQDAMDLIYQYLLKNCMPVKHIWDVRIAKRWKTTGASEKQRELIRRLDGTIDTRYLDKFSASNILNRLLWKRKFGI